MSTGRPPIIYDRKGKSVKGYHTKWTIPDEHRESAEYIEAGTRIALGQAVYDRRTHWASARPSLPPGPASSRL